MKTLLSLHYQHILILLILLSGIYLIYRIFKKSKTIGFTILIGFTLLCCISFYNRNYSIKAEIEKAQTSNVNNNLKHNSITSVYNQEDFIIHTFRNKLEFPLPNYLELWENDEESELFRYKKELSEKNKNISLTGVGISIEPKKTNLNQYNISTIPDQEMDTYLMINEKMIKQLLPSWGLTEYQLINSSITTSTSNYGCNYIKMIYTFNNLGREATATLILIPTKKDIIRVLTFNYAENNEDIITLIDNIKLLD